MSTPNLTKTSTKNSHFYDYMMLYLFLTIGIVYAIIGTETWITLLHAALAGAWGADVYAIRNKVKKKPLLYFLFMGACAVILGAVVSVLHSTFSWVLIGGIILVILFGILMKTVNRKITPAQPSL